MGFFCCCPTDEYYGDPPPDCDDCTASFEVVLPDMTTPPTPRFCASECESGGEFPGTYILDLHDDQENVVSLDIDDLCCTFICNTQACRWKTFKYLTDPECAGLHISICPAAADSTFAGNHVLAIWFGQPTGGSYAPEAIYLLASTSFNCSGTNVFDNNSDVYCDDNTTQSCCWPDQLTATPI